MAPPEATETRWTLIARAASTEEPDADALNELLTLYTPVLRGFVRRWPGLDEATGEDLVQGFVHQRILEKQLLQKADSTKGRFRTFLFRSFRNYITDEQRKQQAARRTPGQGNLVSFDEIEGGVGEDSEMERAFHVAWVRQIVEEASRRMKAHCERKGRMDCWLVFELRMYRPLIDGVEPIPYEELVDQLNLKSPSQASNVLITSKRMMKGFLEDVIQETVSNPDDVAEEWAFLKAHIAPEN